jgi:hypothetical protein
MMTLCVFFYRCIVPSIGCTPPCKDLRRTRLHSIHRQLCGQGRSPPSTWGPTRGHGDCTLGHDPRCVGEGTEKAGPTPYQVPGASQGTEVCCGRCCCCRCGHNMHASLVRVRLQLGMGARCRGCVSFHRLFPVQHLSAANRANVPTGMPRTCIPLPCDPTLPPLLLYQRRSSSLPPSPSRTHGCCTPLCGADLPQSLLGRSLCLSPPRT